jgi:hypothetical protein
MITGAHAILYSTNAEADRSFLRDMLGLTHVDVGDGWLIFGLPPSEIAIHPSDTGGAQELYLLCDDVNAFCAAMALDRIACTDPVNRGWGVLTTVTLPGGGKLGVYEPRHARPAPMGLPAAKDPAAKRPPAKQPAAKQPAAKKPAAKKPAKKPAVKKRR